MKMPRKIVVFDCDGVLTPGGFVPPELRTNKEYCKDKSTGRCNTQFTLA